MLINNVDVKNLDILANVIKELANKLSYVGYHYGSLEYFSRDNTVTSFFIENWNDITKGIEKTPVATYVENENDDNYHFDSETLYLTSTVLNSGNLLVELSSDVMAESGNFRTASGNFVLKTYLVTL